MHSPAMIIIKNHHQELRAEAEAYRLAKMARNARGTRRGPIAGAFSSLRSLLSSAEQPMGLPKLTDYPYRS